MKHNSFCVVKKHLYLSIFYMAFLCCIRLVDAQTVITAIDLPDIPQSISINSTTNRIYVGTRDSNTGGSVQSLEIINGSSNTIEDSLELGKGSVPPLAVNHVTNIIYAIAGVGLDQNPAIRVIDGSTNKIIDDIEIDDLNSTTIGVNPETNMIYVVTRPSTDPVGALNVIDGETNRVVDKVTIGSHIVGFAIGVDTAKNRIYVVNSGDETVTVVDGFTNKVIDTITLGGATGPPGIAVNSNTNRIYAPLPFDEKVVVIDGADNQIIETITFEDNILSGGINVNSATNRIYIPGSGGLVLDGETHEIVKRLDLDQTTAIFGFGVNPQTSFVYAIISDSKEIKQTVVIQDGSDGIPFPTPTPTSTLAENEEKYEYDDAGRLVSVDYGNGGSISYKYDNNGNLLRKELVKSSDIITVPTLTEIIAAPEMFKSSLLSKPVTITALDQDGKPMEGISINAAVSEGESRVTVTPASEVTGLDGTAEFKVRFGFLSTGGKVTFTSESFTATVTQE